MTQRHLEQKIRGSSFKARNRHEDRLATGAPSKGQSIRKTKQNAKHYFQRGDCIRNKANVHLEKHAQSSMTRTREAKGRDVFSRLLRQVHRTENRTVTEEVAMAEVQKAQKILEKSPSGKANRLPCTNLQERKIAKGDIHVTTWRCSRKIQNSMLLVDARFGRKCAYTYTTKPCDELRHSASIAIHNPFER